MNLSSVAECLYQVQHGTCLEKLLRFLRSELHVFDILSDLHHPIPVETGERLHVLSKSIRLYIHCQEAGRWLASLSPAEFVAKQRPLAVKVWSDETIL